MNFKVARVSKVKKVNELWQKLLDREQVELKNQGCLKGKNTIISEMKSSTLVRYSLNTGLAFCATENFPTISMFVDPFP